MDGVEVGVVVGNSTAASRVSMGMLVGEAMFVAAVTGIGSSVGVVVVPGKLQAESPKNRTRTVKKRRLMYSSCSNTNAGTMMEQESLRTIFDSSYIMTVTLVTNGGFHEKVRYRFNFITGFPIKQLQSSVGAGDWRAFPV